MKREPPPSRRQAVVAGGASGIGLACAKRLSALHEETVVLDVEPPAAPVPRARYVPLDLGAPIDPKALAAAGLELDTPTTLVLSAGLGVHERLDEGDPAHWQRVIEVNLLGALRLVRLVVPRMRGEGDVVFLSSVAARRGYPYGGPYAASKAGLERAAEALRLEVRPGIRVSVVAPGVVDTPFFQRAFGGQPTPEQIGWGALSAEDVADVVAFVVTRRRHVAIHEVVVRPVAQEL